MGRIVIVIGLAAIALILVSWFSRTRTARQKWLLSLELPGSWEQDDPNDTNNPMTIAFSGDLHNGTYEMRCLATAKEGTWRISQSSLLLSDAADGETSYELRLFEKGKIGLHGNDMDHQTFSKRTDNIVPLHRK